MNDLLKHLGLYYHFQRGVTSVPDDVNIIKKTSYAYHMKCRIGIAYKIDSVYLRNDEFAAQAYLKFVWISDMSYLGEK